MDRKIFADKKYLVYPILLLVIALVLSSCGDITPRQRGYINDRAGVLNSRTSAEMNALAGEIKAKSGVEFVIVVVKNTGSFSMEEYASSVSDKWKIGAKQGSDKGSLLLISVKDKAAYIWNTPDLNGVFSAIRKKIIIEVLMSPGLKAGDYSKAAASAMVESAKIIRDNLKADIRPVYHQASF